MREEEVALKPRSWRRGERACILTIDFGEEWNVEFNEWEEGRKKGKEEREGKNRR